MYVVIEISEKAYNLLKDGGIDWLGSAYILGCVAEGKVLPKGHDRLIDAREYENSIRKHYFDNSTVIRCTEIALDNAPTIIEADKAEEDTE